MFALKPGAAGPWRSVQEMLRQRHEEVAASVNKAIERRKALGIPLDDERLDWRADFRAALDLAANEADRGKAQDAIEKARQIAAGGLQPLGEYEPEPALDGVEVRLRAVSKSEMIQLRIDLAASKDDEAQRFAVIKRFLTKSLAGARIDLGDEGSLDVEEIASDQIGDVVDAVDRAGLAPVLFACARNFQDLPPLLRRGFGSPRPSTSLPSSAVSVPSLDGAPLAASAAPRLGTSEVRSGKPIAAPSVMSSTTTTTAGPFDLLSPSIGPVTGKPDLTVSIASPAQPSTP